VLSSEFSSDLEEEEKAKSNRTLRKTPQICLNETSTVLYNIDCEDVARAAHTKAQVEP